MSQLFSITSAIMPRRFNMIKLTKTKLSASLLLAILFSITCSSPTTGTGGDDGDNGGNTPPVLLSPICGGSLGADTTTTPATFTPAPVPVPVDSKGNSLLSGTGTKMDPWVIPIEEGCTDFSFVFDPNIDAANAVNALWFAVDIPAGNYSYTLINGGLLPRAIEGIGWFLEFFNSTGANSLTNMNTEGFSVNDSVGDMNGPHDVTTTENRALIKISTDRVGNTQFLSPRGIRIKRKTS